MRSEGNASKNVEPIGYLLHDNALAHRSVFVKNFITKNNMTTLEHPLYSPDLVPADFYLFPPLKSALKGRSFCDSTGIIKNVTELMKRIPQNGFQERFQHL
jgi:transposase